MALSLESLIDLEKGFVWVILALTLLYFWSTSNFGVWASLGVPYRRPVPFFGNLFRAATGSKTTFQIQQELYYAFKDSTFVGTFRMMTPLLMIKDPAIIEHIMVKDFSSFMDRGTGVDPNRPGMNAHLLNLNGQQWRSLRNKLTPVFTSGKMKGMMDQLEQCTKRLENHLEKAIEKGEPVEAKYEMSGLTMDVIASCAFGLDFNSIDDPNSMFRQIGERVFKPSKLMVVKRFLNERMPLLLRAIRFFFDRKRLDIDVYFTSLVKNTMRLREEQGIQRQDFIHLLMEIRKQEKDKNAGPNEVLLTDSVMTSNAFVFLLAGYETTATTLSFLMYELAVNPNVQERLYREVTKTLRKHEGPITWETLKEMKYLEMVVSEALRKYPPATELRRICLAPYTFPKSNLQIQPGTIVSVPVFSLHHDPQYYPDPDKFDPERFSEANRPKMVKYTYLPFGDGPRICIGMRFALMEIKIAVISLIQKFKVKLNPKTISPLKMDPGAFLMGPVGGIWLDFSIRNKEE